MTVIPGFDTRLLNRLVGLLGDGIFPIQFRKEFPVFPRQGAVNDQVRAEQARCAQ